MSDPKKTFCQAIESRRNFAHSLNKSFEQALSIAIPHSSAILKNSEYQGLLSVAYQTLDMVEVYGEKKAFQTAEPPYHNRQHFADACLSLAYFLRDIHHFSEYEKLLLLLAMLVHDFGHAGMSNKIDHMTHEEETVTLLKNSPLNSLPKKDFDLICELIIGTTPKYLPKINARHLSNPDNPHYFKQSLINDADIAASYIDSLTPTLTKLILMESGNHHPNENDINAAIAVFKKNFHLTTTIAKSYLL